MARQLKFASLLMLGVLSSTASAASLDINILNFALNLECLEAQFYSWAAFGHGLSKKDRGGGPLPTGGRKAALSPAALTFAVDLANRETEHVRFLRATLGHQAVACPAVDLGRAFAAVANAALNTTLHPPFTPYGSDLLFFHGAFLFEDVGVTGYHGAVTLFTNKNILQAATGILPVEAYHAGAIRALLYQHAKETIFPYGKTVEQFTAAIAALRAKASGAKDDFGITHSTGVLLAPTDSNGLAFSRTARQVLNVVYLGGKTKGGFFPNGLNGAITQ